jgi:hypothetical protein
VELKATIPEPALLSTLETPKIMQEIVDVDVPTAINPGTT